MKKVIAACIEQILEFDSQEEAAAYIEKLRNLGKAFRVIQRGDVANKCQIRIQKQYNSSSMIEN